MFSNGSRAAVVRTGVLIVCLAVLIVAFAGLRRRPASAAPAGGSPGSSAAFLVAERGDADGPPPPAPPADPPPGFGLTASNLLLIVNQNEPAGRRLAEFYCAQRHVPAGRILALDLPAADELPFDQYNAVVVPAVRAYLADHRIADEVTCLVTFFGVPLRVGPRANTPAESAEYRDVTAQARQAVSAARQAVSVAEDLARQSSDGFRPPPVGEDARGLVARFEAAADVALAGMAAERDADRRASRFARLTAAAETLLGPLETLRLLGQPKYLAGSGRPPAPDRAAQATTKAAAVAEELKPLVAASASDAAARAKVRDVVAANLGALGSIQVLTDHKLRLETGETEAAVDSELACLWWPDDRLRYRWQDNPLYFQTRLARATAGNAKSANGSAAGDPASAPAAAASRPVFARPSAAKTLMVTRIDAPSERLAHELIATSVRVEAAGLRGDVALDARGKSPTDPYGRFDEGLRQLASELSSHPPTKVTLDDREAVFLPGAVRDVALYCGWYSLRNYVPGMTFVPGAVGYHVASLELVSLHHAGEKGWVRGLMADGVVATVGAVAEPYLHAFPPPAEFFPLLATGRLTLAEVYWSTTPLASWMTTCVGDPLYRPYAVDPLLARDAVPSRLRPVLDGGMAAAAAR